MIRTSGIVLFLGVWTAAAAFAQDKLPAAPPMDGSFFQAQALRALNEKVDLLLDLKKTDLAIQELRRVYTFDVPKTQPSYEIKVRLIGRLAEVYAASGKRSEALDTVKGMLADVAPGTPAEAAAWLEAGTVYRAVAMPDEALKAFDRAIELSNRLAQTGWRPPGRDRPHGPRDGESHHPRGEGPPDGAAPPPHEP